MYTDRQYIEIFHLLFLRHLENKIDKNLYALKGGCNLRFFFKSIRYSEDIDFDVRILSKETLRNKVNKLLESAALIQSLKSRGIKIAYISESKQSDTTQRWKLHLQATGISIPLPTKIEFSRRNMNDHFLFEPVDKDLINAYQLYPIIANHYICEEALNQKINALINCSETQARDIFDIKLLLDLNINTEILGVFTKLELNKAIDNIMSINFSEFKGQVVAYLMIEYHDYYDNPKIWHSIQKKIISFLEEMGKKYEIN